jgi:hypothetical protein
MIQLNRQPAVTDVALGEDVISSCLDLGAVSFRDVAGAPYPGHVQFRELVDNIGAGGVTASTVRM